MNRTQTQPQESKSWQPYQGDRPIVFFDGDCIMCNAFVDRLLQIDPEGRVFIATLQGQTAQRYLPPLPPAREDWSFFYLDQEGFYDQSEAFVRLCKYLGGIWHLLGLMKLIPAPLRNWVYRFIARNRYRWFGRRSTCRIPTVAEHKRFLP